MKNLIMILSVVAIAFYGCEDKKKDLANQYDQLMQSTDSLQQEHMEFKSMHEQAVSQDSNLAAQLKAGQIQDSTLLEAIAAHEVIFKKHEAMMASHEELLNSHALLKDEFDTKSEAEIEAQIKEMEEINNKIEEEHNTMMDEHDQIMQDQQDLQEKLMDSVPNDGDASAQ